MQQLQIPDVWTVHVQDCPASRGPVSQRRLMTRTTQQKVEDYEVKTHFEDRVRVPGQEISLPWINRKSYNYVEEE